MKYKCASHDKAYCPIEKIAFKYTYGVTDLNCTHVTIGDTLENYATYDKDWKKQMMTVNYSSYPSIEIVNNGNKFRKLYNFVSKTFNIYPGEDTDYRCGKIISGPCKGGIACESVDAKGSSPVSIWYKTQPNA